MGRAIHSYFYYNFMINMDMHFEFGNTVTLINHYTKKEKYCSK
jgi:hypothetical protein